MTYLVFIKICSEVNTFSENMLHVILQDISIEVPEGREPLYGVCSSFLVLRMDIIICYAICPGLLS
jgi:hypothetical protein